MTKVICQRCGNDFEIVLPVNVVRARRFYRDFAWECENCLANKRKV